MALQRINWTQIDAANVPTGTTVDLGSPETDLHGVYTENLEIRGKDFFEYLQDVGYTGHTPNDINVEPNSGIDLSGHTLFTTYNTILDPTLATPVTVGGIPAGTTVQQLSGKTFVEFVDELLFPVVLPTYIIPTITMTGIESQTVEILSQFSPSLNGYGIKNDAGSFTQLRLLRNGVPIVTELYPAVSPDSSMPPQFGFPDPNNPNLRYAFSSPYVESYQIPYPIGSNTSSSTTYSMDGNYGIGFAKKNNKGVLDNRAAAIRSANAPQAGSNNFGSSIYTITGIYPYFYGTSATLPTPASIASAISSGSGIKVLLSANGTITIPYNISGLYIWFAYFTQYPIKTKWYVTALDTGDMDGSFMTSGVDMAVNSPNGYWSGINYTMHWSVYPTIQNTIEFRNS